MTQEDHPTLKEDGGSARLRHVSGQALQRDTAQTGGMQRFEALSGRSVGTRSIWMGQTRMAPGAVSGAHHHGPSETGIYVLTGRPAFVYLEGDHEVRLECEPGDYVYVPPFAPHIESNQGSTEEAVVVLVRTTQEAIVENLASLHDSLT